MHYEKYILPIAILILGGFLLMCSNAKNNKSSGAQSAKELKAKIIYFSIPG